MSKVTVELEWDTVYSIVISQLKDNLAYLTTELENKKSENPEIEDAIFSTDKSEDIAMIEEHINAVKTVLNYYGEDL
jgi:hypothetical protein